MTSHTTSKRQTAAEAPPRSPRTAAAGPIPPRQFHSRKLWDIPNYVAMILVSLVCLVPVAVMLRIAVTPQVNWRQIPIDWLQAPDWTSFERVLGSTFPRALLNSFLIALVTTAVVVVLSAMGGHALA